VAGFYAFPKSPEGSLERRSNRRRPGLSKRDRSLITLAALTALYRPDQLKGHTERALANGVTKEEIGELITHLAFYAGWPSAMSAAKVVKQVVEEKKA
jgi:4-carboxymuconolactone decarboxylase